MYALQAQGKIVYTYSIAFITILGKKFQIQKFTKTGDSFCWPKKFEFKKKMVSTMTATG